jgi:hypothetical protein
MEFYARMLGEQLRMSGVLITAANNITDFVIFQVPMTASKMSVFWNDVS